MISYKKDDSWMEILSVPIVIMYFGFIAMVLIGTIKVVSIFARVIGF